MSCLGWGPGQGRTSGNTGEPEEGVGLSYHQCQFSQHCVSAVFHGDKRVREKQVLALGCWVLSVRDSLDSFCDFSLNSKVFSSVQCIFTGHWGIFMWLCLGASPSLHSESVLVPSCGLWLYSASWNGAGETRRKAGAGMVSGSPEHTVHGGLFCVPAMQADCLDLTPSFILC